MSGVCIDGHNLALPTGSGIATYSRALLVGIRALGARAHVLHGPLIETPKEPLLREISISDARLAAKALAATQPSRHIQVALAGLGRKAMPVQPTGRIVWPDGKTPPEADTFWLSDNLYRISSRAFSKNRTVTPVDFAGERSLRPDVMHWTYPAPLRARSVPNIYTFHDLIPLKLPHTTLDDKTRYLDLCRSIARRADHLLAVSETTRQDVISLLGVEPDRITTTWQTADMPRGAGERSETEIAKTLADQFGVEWKSYFVFFGAIEPKKNLGRLVEAYLRSGVDTPLIVVGGRSWLDEAESGFLNELIASGTPAGRRLRKFDYLPRKTLVELVQGARATLFPSLYEGFGLPVLESMMLGTPVLASTAGSLPEIAGDAALTADPYDVDAMARAIQQLDGDSGLRDELSKRGKSRAEFFSADAYRERLRGVYEKLGAL